MGGVAARNTVIVAVAVSCTLGGGFLTFVERDGLAEC